MRKTTEYIESVKQRAGIKTDNELAMMLGITKSYMSLIAKGKRNITDEIALALAKIAGDKPEEILLLAHVWNADDQSRPVWNNLLKKLASVALGAGIFFRLLSTLPSINALQKSLSSLYIMLN